MIIIKEKHMIDSLLTNMYYWLSLFVAMPPGHNPNPGGTLPGDAVTAPIQHVATPPPDTGGGFNPMIMILLYVAVFAAAYFFMIRPHRKREKAIKELQSTIKQVTILSPAMVFLGVLQMLAQTVLLLNLE